MSYTANYIETDRNSEWSAIKAKVSPEVYAKTNGICFYCGFDGANTIDHFHPYSKGGTDRIGNLVPSCHPCNCSKGARSLEDWRFSLRFKQAREEYGVPFMSVAAVQWLADKGVDVLEDVPEKIFWFEAHGFDLPRRYEVMPSQYLDDKFGGRA